MNRCLDFEIKEKEEYLEGLFIKEKDLRLKERLQVLYLIKSKEVVKIVKLAKIIGKNRRAIGAWIRKYEEGGLNGLLERKTSLGRPGAINLENEVKLKEELSKEKGFKSYSEIQEWLSKELSIKMKYKAVFNICHNKLGASPKVSRPRNPKQDINELKEFKKKNLVK